MTNADSARPPARVPDAPVVDISITGDVVTVDGVGVAHDGTRPLHHVAVHAAAERVARPLGRPVRAVATDSEGRATLVVHPDGRATDVELVESFQAEPSEAAPTLAMPLAPTSPVAPPAVTAALPTPVQAAEDPEHPGHPGTSQPPLPAPAALRSTTPAPAVAGRGPGWPSRIVRTVAVAAALVAVVGVGVLLLNQGEDATDDLEPTTVAASGPVEPEASAEPTPEATPEPVASSSLPAGEPTGPTLTVTPVAGTGALRLTLDLEAGESAEAGTEPLTARVSVLAAGATKPLRRTVTLDESSTDVTLGKGRLPGGAATWEVQVAGLPTQEGSVTILGPYVPPAPSPSAAPEVPVAPVAPVAPAPVAPPVTVTATPKPAPQPPRATNKPQPKPPAQAPKKKKPSKSRLKQ